MRRRTPRPTSLVSRMEIKKREVLFGVIIVLVMLAIGVFASGVLQENLQGKAERYATAVRISSPDTFSYSMKTNVGNALVYGELSADQPVISPDLPGSYMRLEKKIEEYTMHTRTVTYTDSNGHTHTRVETYYTWDYIGGDSWESETLTILGESFPTENFSLPSTDLLELTNGSTYKYQTPSIRYYFSGLPASFDATISADLRDGGVGEEARVFREKTPDQVVEDSISDQTVFLIGFWIAWVLLTGMALAGFFYLENGWLDDRPARYRR